MYRCVGQTSRISSIVSARLTASKAGHLTRETALSVDLPPLTHISVRRTLKGTDQSKGQLAVVIDNHHNRQTKVSYLETMPWLLQFHLNSMQVKWNDVPRGTYPRLLSFWRDLNE